MPATARSHRDHRMDGAIADAFWLMLGVVAGLSVLIFVAPWPVVGLTALVGLAVVGGYYVLRSERAISEYTDDLQSVRGGGAAGGWTRVEVDSAVGRDRPVELPTRASPHVRARGNRAAAPPPVPEPGD